MLSSSEKSRGSSLAGMRSTASGMRCPSAARAKMKTVSLSATLDASAAFKSTRPAIAEPAVQQCHRVSPGPDFMLVVQLADMSAYDAFVERLLTRDANVRNVKAFFSVHRAKFGTAISLPAPGG